MGLIDRLFSKKKNTDAQENSGQTVPAQSVIDIMLVNAEACLNEGKPERAFKTYNDVLEIQPENSQAQYNLGTLYALGKGTEQDFLKSAKYFSLVASKGDSEAKKMCEKSTLYYVNQNLASETPYDVYQKMLTYASVLYPQNSDNGTASQKSIASEKLFAVGSYDLNQKRYEEAVKLFRASGEYGNHGKSQNYLAVLYNAGAGTEKNDLAALYWFDRAADNGVQEAQKDRDGILNAYRKNNSPEEFAEIIEQIVKECSNGSKDIPRDDKKAEYWCKRKGKMLNAKTQSKSETRSKSDDDVKKYEDTVEKTLNYICRKNEGKRMSFAISIPDTKNMAVFTFEPGGTDNGWIYSVGVVRNGTNMLVSNYLNHGSREEVMEYLKSEKARTETLDVVRRLSDNVDERMM